MMPLKQTALRRASILLQAGLVCLMLLACVQGQSRRPLQRAAGSQPLVKNIDVDGTPRTALLFVPPEARNIPSPIVFAFHGHGGSMRQSASSFGFQRLWEAAIIVYPQGLPTASPLDPQGRLPGWSTAEPYETNRDLRFFDLLLASLKQDYKVDQQQIYASGHSNGGYFTYTLWAARPEVFAAMAPSACTLGRLGPADRLQPRPVLHVAGEDDKLVSIVSQRETIERLRVINGCEGEAEDRRPPVRVYPSSGGTPVVTFIHAGGHAFPKEASPAIINFFKRRVSREGDVPAATPQP